MVVLPSMYCTLSANLWRLISISIRYETFHCLWDLLNCQELDPTEGFLKLPCIDSGRVQGLYDVYIAYVAFLWLFRTTYSYVLWQNARKNYIYTVITVVSVYIYHRHLYFGRLHEFEVCPVEESHVKSAAVLWQIFWGEEDKQEVSFEASPHTDMDMVETQARLIHYSEGRRRQAAWPILESISLVTSNHHRGPLSLAASCYCQTPLLLAESWTIGGATGPGKKQTNK